MNFLFGSLKSTWKGKMKKSGKEKNAGVFIKINLIYFYLKLGKRRKYLIKLIII